MTYIHNKFHICPNIYIYICMYRYFHNSLFFSIPMRIESNKYTIGHICFIFLLPTSLFMMHVMMYRTQKKKMLILNYMTLNLKNKILTIKWTLFISNKMETSEHINLNKSLQFGF